MGKTAAPAAADDNAMLMTTDEVAALTQIPKRTLEDWRMGRTRGPAFLPISRRIVRYRRADVEKWLASISIDTSESKVLK